MEATLHATADEPVAREDGQACHRRGIQLLRQGNLDEAITELDRAATLQPRSATAYNDLANALRLAGRVDEAIACYRRAVLLRPDVLALHGNLAGLLTARDPRPEALTYARAASQPATPDVYSRLGAALLDLEFAAEAAACYRFALRRSPNDFAVLNNLGTALWDQGDSKGAGYYYRRALDVCPGHPDALTNLGNVFRDNGELEEAEACYRESLPQRPLSVPVWVNLGVVLDGQGRFDESLACLRKALELDPNSPYVCNSLGATLGRTGRVTEAIEFHERALELRPNFAEAHLNRAMAWLSQGDYERGWREYEWRWRCRGKAPVFFPQPRWEGQDLQGRTILLYADLGHGDSLQFIRYAALVKSRGATVVLVCPPPLVSLLARSPGVDRVLPAGADLPEFDFHASLMGLPAIFETTLSTVPAAVPYLHPDAEAVERWRGVLQHIKGFKVGINWQGNPRYGMDRYRSCPLAKFAPLAAIEGVHLISLQRGAGTDQLRQLDGRFAVDDLGGEEQLGKFDVTAALVQNLDLVVTTDTAMAHLAGGLGARTWIALPSVAEWRWLTDRDDSPWYPSARLFRQRSAGDWDGVFERMAQALLR